MTTFVFDEYALQLIDWFRQRRQGVKRVIGYSQPHILAPGHVHLTS